jgi:glycosyltransferase involved in cell wall biosynthesis
MSKKKVLFLVHLAPPIHGAAIMNALYLRSKTVNSNFSCRYVKLNYSRTLEDIGRFNAYKIAGFFLVLFKIFKNLILFRPNLIYFEIAPSGLGFLRDSFFVLLCKAVKRKIVFHLQAKGISEAIKRRCKLQYYNLVFKNTKIILLSKLLYHDVENIFKPSDVYILPNCLKDELTDCEFRKYVKYRSKKHRPILLFLSNMIESKGPLDVLKVCNALNNDGIDFKCLFVGPWESKETEMRWYSLLKQYGLGEKVKYLGAKYGNEKKQILKNTDFLIFPTRYKLETFGLVGAYEVSDRILESPPLICSVI